MSTLALLLMFTVGTAHAISFNDGLYDTYNFVKMNYPGYPDHVPEGSVRLKRDGKVVVIDDFKNGITYRLDPTNPGEQEVNPLLLTKLRSSPGTRQLGGILDRITVSEVQEAPGNRLTANFNLRVRYQSPVGSPVSANFRIGTQVTAATCPLETQNYRSVERNGYTTTEFAGSTYQQVSCLSYEVGTQVALLDLDTGLPDTVNRAAAIIGDLVLKLMSPIFSDSNTYYEKR